MNGASKILTVSYGTFSCTLEGFDDPFNTMKAIAEYFRDLAAEDRYFGAEPPQPDAAMLHRIAEREIQRRVEAKIQDNGVILRAEENEAIAAPRVTAPGPSRQESADTRPKPVVEMPARAPAAPARPAPVLAEADSVPHVEVGAESVAEKLSRLRKAAAENQDVAATATIVTATAPAVTAHDDTFAEDDLTDLSPYTQVSDTQAADTQAPDTQAPDTRASGTIGDIADLLPEDDASTDAVLPEDLPTEAQAEGALDTTPQDSGDADDIADLLALDAATATDLARGEHTATDEQAGAGMAAAMDAQDSRESITDQSKAQDLDSDDGDDALLASLVSEGVPADGANTAQPAPISEEDTDDALLASLGALIDPEDEEDEYASPETAAHVPQALEALRDVSAADAMDSVVAEETAEADSEELTADAAEQDEGAVESEARQEDVPLAAEPEPLQGAGSVDAAPAGPVRPVRPVRAARSTAIERPAVPADLVAELSSDAIAETESRTPITVEKLQRARARVIKIRRNDAAPDAQMAAARPAPAAPAAAALSDEAEAALAAELASVQQDGPHPADPVQHAGSAPDRRLGLPAEDVAVNRLMAEASTQMEVPDTKRRQSAIAHLKAAVAATIAERRATGSTLAGNGSERLGAYRNDLAKVVRPSSDATPTTGERPSPLVLVSEQRIDRPVERTTYVPADPVPAQTVRPSRPIPPSPAAAPHAFAPDLDDELDLNDEAGNIFEADSGFPDFAERLGATDLPALLEAAAAYIACVEGRDSFTRPQLMRHINAAADGLSREDGLRSFGTLLRDGVIERSRRGQFAISQTSPLLAEARKIAG